MTRPPAGVAPPSGRAPTSLNVVRGDGAERLSEPVDWRSWYLTDEEDMGQSPTSDVVIRIIEDSLRQLFQERGLADRFVGRDHFFGWRPDHPLVRVSPDVHVFPFIPRRPYPDSWQVWRQGHAPPWVAFEVVSQDWRKDYEQNPPKYAQLGCQELIIFDPLPRGGRAIPLQLYRRTADGLLVQTASGDGPVYSEALEIWLHADEQDGWRELRLAYDEAGLQVVPTLGEAQERARDDAQRAQEETQRAQEEAQRARDDAHRVRDQAQLALQEARAQAEAEQASREAAEAELRELRAALAAARPLGTPGD